MRGLAIRGAWAVRWLAAAMFLLFVSPCVADDPPAKKSSFSFSKFYFGGGIGLGVGDVTYFEVAPLIGYRVNSRVDLGGSVLYRYRDDDRYEDDLSTRDYGASLFTRYRVVPRVFLHGEYEYLDYEYAVSASSTDNDTYHSVLGGVGMFNRTGGRSSVFLLALYNFTYDDDEISPYSEPWIVRGGISFGF